MLSVACMGNGQHSGICGETPYWANVKLQLSLEEMGIFKINDDDDSVILEKNVKNCLV